MTFSRIATIASFGVAIAASLGIFLLSALYMGSLSPLAFFMDAPIVLKLLMLCTLIVAFCAAVLVAIALFTRPAAGQTPSTVEIMLWLAAAAAASLGLLGAAYGEMNTQIAIAAVGPVRFGVTAPSRIEALLCLALGFWPASVCLLTQTWLMARRRRVIT